MCPRSTTFQIQSFLFTDEFEFNKVNFFQKWLNPNPNVISLLHSIYPRLITLARTDLFD